MYNKGENFSDSSQPLHHIFESENFRFRFLLRTEIYQISCENCMLMDGRPGILAVLK